MAKTKVLVTEEGNVVELKEKTGLGKKILGGVAIGAAVLFGLTKLIGKVLPETNEEPEVEIDEEFEEEEEEVTEVEAGEETTEE